MDSIIPTGSATLAASTAGVGAAQYLGPLSQITVAEFGWTTAFAIMGIICRQAIQVQTLREREQKSGVPMEQRTKLDVTTLVTGLLGAPFIGSMILMILKYFGQDIDPLTLMGVLALGFFGPDIIDPIRRKFVKMVGGDK